MIDVFFDPFPAMKALIWTFRCSGQLFGNNLLFTEFVDNSG